MPNAGRGLRIADRELRITELALIAALVGIAYGPALTGTPVWDDAGHLTRPDLRPLSGLWRIWTEIGATQQYYPALHSAFWIEHRLWGDRVVGYHLVSVATHALAASLLAAILRRLCVPGALLAALIFALHPVMVESVAWISEQKNTLSAVFYLASALAYLHFDASRRRAPYWLSFALFVLALLTKTVTATLPAALLLILWWQRGTLRWNRDVLPVIPWFAAAAAMGCVTIWFERDLIGARGEEFTLTLLERTLLAGRAFWFYLGKLLWPADLMFVYPRWRIDATEWRQYLFPLGTIVLIAGAWLFARRSRGPLTAVLFFLGTLAPALGFVDVYPFRFSYVADHFQYLASLGVIVAVAAALSIARGRLPSLPKQAVSAGSAAVITVLAFLTWREAATYQDAETLYRKTIARNPQCWMCYMNLGTELAKAPERLPESIPAFEGALRVRPDYPEARRNLALAHTMLGSSLSDSPATTPAALAHLREAVRIAPDSSLAHYTLANVLSRTRRPGAIEAYQETLRLDPRNEQAHLNLAVVLSETPGRIPDAIRHYSEALAIKPDYFSAHYNLGTLLLDDPRRRTEAIAHLQAALQIDPASGEAHLNMAVALADTPGQEAEAIRHLETALARQPSLAPARDLLAELQRRGGTSKGKR